MAPRKKRTTRKKKPARSPSAAVTMSALIILGGTAVWASSQNKSPSESISQLVRKTASLFTPTSTAPSKYMTTKATSATKNSQPKRTETSMPATTAAIARPPLPLGSSVDIRPASKPQPPARAKIVTSPATPVTNPQTKNVTIAKPTRPDLPPTSQRIEPNSRNASGAYKRPKVIIARQPLEVRARAWSEADPVGKVEKGREMRSYAKVGKWHRVVVPASDIIGWVHEDHLIVKADKSDGRAEKRITSGSAATKATKPTARADQAGNTAKANSGRKSGLTKPVYPSRPVGTN